MLSKLWMYLEGISPPAHSYKEGAGGEFLGGENTGFLQTFPTQNIMIILCVKYDRTQRLYS